MIDGGAEVLEAETTTPSLRELGKARRSQRILRAARALIASDGIDGLTMRRLADRAEVSVRTLYNLSLGRDAVIDALTAEYLDEVDTALAAIDSLDPLDRAEAVVTCSLDILFQDEAFHRHLHGAVLPIGRGDQLRHGFRAQQMMARAIETGVRNGSLDDSYSPELLSRQALLAHLETIRLWANGVFTPDVARAQSLSALYICLLAIARPRTRKELFRRIEPLTPVLASLTPEG